MIDRIPWLPLVVIAIFMGIAPVAPEPHLWEKIKMLVHGTLTRPIDIFDFFMHLTPIVLVIVKGVRQVRSGKGDTT